MQICLDEDWEYVLEAIQTNKRIVETSNKVIKMNHVGMYCLIQCLINAETLIHIVFFPFSLVLRARSLRHREDVTFLKYIETETPELKLSAFCPDSFHTPICQTNSL